MDSQLLAKKHEIINTTNTVGWTLIKELGESTITQMEREAIDEDDDAKGAVLRRQAKAARVFFNDFLTAINSYRQVEQDNSTDDDFMTYD